VETQSRSDHEEGLRHTHVPIGYKALRMEDGLRLDLLVGDLVVVELKAQENYHPVGETQILSYLRLTEKRPGLLINFHGPHERGNEKIDVIKNS
jgi:GxxExxY protein